MKRTLYAVVPALLILLTALAAVRGPESEALPAERSSSFAEVPGTTEGVFQVDGNGAANYKIPIEVPPGRAGMEPQLALQYNSQGGNGLVGVGWSLSGLAAVSRCPQTLAQDNARRGIQFDSNDRFCLHGQRLVPVYGSPAGIEYHTERESWMKVYSHGTAGSGPQYFTAVAKDGTQIFYGNTSDSRIEAQGRSDVRVWAVNEITDRNGNYLTVTYQENSSSGEYYPIQIDYTGNENVHSYQPRRSVVFHYEDRNDDIVGYVAGSKTSVEHLLSSIETRVDDTTVKTYSLTYTTSSATGRSLLSSVQECGASTCLPPTTFEWDDGADIGTWTVKGEESAGTNQSDTNKWFSMDVDGDGISDVINVWLWSGNAHLQAYLSNGDGTWSQQAAQIGPATDDTDLTWIPGDVNGDGLTDIVTDWGDSPHYLQAYLSNGDGTFEVKPRQTASTSGLDSNQWLPVDLDGDSKTDILNMWTEHSSNHYMQAYFSNGDGTWTQKSWEQKGTSGSSSNRWIPMDANGDGMTDVLNTWIESNDLSVQAYLSAGDGSFNRQPIQTFSDADISSSTFECYPVEINGDGRADFVFRWGTSSHYLQGYISKGDGTWDQQTRQSAGSSRSSTNQWLPVEINGDGLTDILNLWVFDDNNHAQVYVADGSGGWTPKPDQDQAAPSSDGNWIVSDVNGDGLSDLINRWGTASHNMQAYISAGPSFDGLSEITDGIGGRTRISYAALTDGSLYTKGTGATYPHQDVQGAFYVVSEHEVANGSAACDGSAPGECFQYQHQYANAILDVERGWEGFAETILIDPQNGTTTTTTHETSFPITGMIASRKTVDTSSNKILSNSSWTNKSSALLFSRVYNVWLDQLQEEEYDDSGTLTHTRTTEYHYDSNYRNILHISNLGDHDDPADEVFFCNHFHDESELSADWWKSSFVIARKVVNDESACDTTDEDGWTEWNPDTDLMWKTYAHDGSMNITAQSEWDDARGELITTSTSYDSLGNVVSATDALGNVSTIAYDSTYFTFPTTHSTPSIGGLHLSSESIYEPHFGIKTRVTDPNDVTLEEIPDGGFDDFGRILSTMGPDPSGDLVVLAVTQYAPGADTGLEITSARATTWDPEWKTCAQEHDTCSLSGTKMVKYGDGSDWVYQLHSDSVSCSNDVFGDPKVGTPKQCFYSDTDWLWSKETVDGLGRTRKVEHGAYEDGTVLVTGDMDLNEVGQAATSYSPYYYTASAECIHTEPDTGTCIDKSTLASTHEYNIRGYPSSITLPDGSLETYSYDFSNRIATTSSPDPRLLAKSKLTTDDLVGWQEAYDSRGRLQTRTAPDGTVETYGYDLLGRLTSVTGPLGETTTITRSSLGKVLTETSPEQGTVTYTYNDNGAVETRVDAKGQEIVYTYDALGRVTERQLYTRHPDPTPVATISYFYDNTSNGNKGLGRLTEISSHEAFTLYTYDATGATVAQRTSLSGLTDDFTFQTSYDALGRLDTATYPDGSQVQQVYAADGSLSQVKDPATDGVVYATFGTPSATGGILGVVYANGTSSTYGYDVMGRMVSSSLTGADKSTLADYQYSWNQADKILKIADQTTNGLTQTFSTSSAAWYDSRGRLLRANGIYGSDTYTYDAAGNLEQKAGNTFTYDSTKKHQLKGVRKASGETIQLSYDANGNLVQKQESGQVTEPEGALQIVSKSSQKCLDGAAAGYTDKVDCADDDRMEWSFQRQEDGSYFIVSSHDGSCLFAGLIEGISNSSNISHWTCADEDAFKWELEAQSNGSFLIQSKKTGKCVNASDTWRLVDQDSCDTGDSKQQWYLQADPNQTWTYDYDIENQLTTVQVGGQTVNTFSYDGYGNRVQKVDYDGEGNVLATSYFPSSLYEMVQPADGDAYYTKYVYGPQGVIVALGAEAPTSGQSFQVSPRELGAAGVIGWISILLLGALYLRMRSSSRQSPLGAVRHRVLSALRRRRWIRPRTAAGWDRDCSTAWLHRGRGRLATTVLVLLTVGFTQVFCPPAGFAALQGDGTPTPNTTVYFHHDHLGSSTLTTNASGEQVSRVVYQPYGEIDESSSTGPDDFRPKFTGKELDEGTGLYYFGARYYDADLGRFITPDPAGQFHSPYLYGAGDPLTTVDPDGRFFFLIAMIVLGAVVGAFMGGAAVNHSMNPASWDWSSGKTWAGIFGGAAIGALGGALGAAAPGLAGAGVAALGLEGTAASVATVGATALALGAIGGATNVAFAAMGGATGSDLGKAFGMGFAMGAVAAIPVVGELATAGWVGYSTIEFINNPSADNGIQLGMSLLFVGLSAAQRGYAAAKSGKRSGRWSAGCSSFPEDTEVLSEDGPKDIEEVEVGDRVWGYHEGRQETDLYEVTHLFGRTVQELIVVEAGDEVIEATTEHRFFTRERGWVHAENLREGDTLVRRDGSTLEIGALDRRERNARVYNFEVDDAHTYFVSSEEILVHNERCTRSAAAKTPLRKTRSGRVSKPPVRFEPDDWRKPEVATPARPSWRNYNATREAAFRKAGGDPTSSSSRILCPIGKGGPGCQGMFGINDTIPSSKSGRALSVMQVDHVKPWKSPGNNWTPTPGDDGRWHWPPGAIQAFNDPANHQAVCLSCNARKGNRWAG